MGLTVVKGKQALLLTESLLNPDILDRRYMGSYSFLLDRLSLLSLLPIDGTNPRLVPREVR